MKDIMSTLDSMRRPRLLMRAARFGVEEYRRDIHLRRYMGQGSLPRSGAALLRLMEIEEEMNQQRRGNAAIYSPMRHVEVLIAMMGEARIARASLVHASGLEPA